MITPFTFSKKHLWTVITPFWLSTDDICPKHVNQHWGNLCVRVCMTSDLYSVLSVETPWSGVFIVLLTWVGSGSSAVGRRQSVGGHGAGPSCLSAEPRGAISSSIRTGLLTTRCLLSAWWPGSDETKKHKTQIKTHIQTVLQRKHGDGPACVSAEQELTGRGQRSKVRWTILHRTGFGPDEWFYSVVVVLVGSCPGGK